MYVANATLAFTRSGIFATSGPGTTTAPLLIKHSAWLAVLELFVHHIDPLVACQEFVAPTDIPHRLSAGLAGVVSDAGSQEVWLGGRRFWLRDFRTSSLRDATRLSESSGKSLLRSIAAAYGFGAIESHHCDETSFLTTVSELYTAGLLSPAYGHVEWAAVRRLYPICNRFGFLRGTPVDRYYLQRFLGRVKDRISGVTVEIGGARDNPRAFGWTNVTTYTSVNLEPSARIDRVGDANDPGLLVPKSVDCVVALNVLEHCAEPWRVTTNIRTWLREGGRAVCMVPNAQRLHRMPQDYWRPLPDGMRSLFREFSQQEVYQYGNPLTVMASYLGVAAEELTAEELDHCNFDYPVATCIVATK